MGRSTVHYADNKTNNSKLDAQMQTLEGLRKLKAEAEKKINQILAEVWGVEYVEPIKTEVENGA